MRKALTLSVVLATAFALAACQPAAKEPNTGAHDLPDFTNAPFQKITEGTTVSLMNPGLGPTKAALYSSTGGEMKPGGTYVVVYFKEDGSYAYAEELVVAADGKYGIMSGFTYDGKKFTFEKSEKLQ